MYTISTMSAEDSIKCTGSMRKSLERKEVSSATNLIDQLPEALLVEILIRLPCKFCFRCKSVSKRWLSLISQPYFIPEFIRLRKPTTGTRGQSELSLLKQNNFVDQAKYLTAWHEKADDIPFTLVCRVGSVLNTNGIFESSGFSLDFLPACQQAGEAGRPSVVGSSRDLLLCSSTRTNQKDYYVCNPLTKQWIQLPQPPNVYFTVLIGFYSDPFISFDDDEQAGVVVDLNFEFHYKVIRMKRRGSNATFEIFSSEKGEWSESSVTTTHIPRLSWHCIDLLTAGIANCGTVHWWWINDGGFAVYDPSQNFIRRIENPNDALPLSKRTSGIGSCRGCIRISHVSRDPDNENDATHFEIWESEDSIAEKWRLVRKVCIRELRADDTELQQEISPMCPDLEKIYIHSDDGDLVFLVFSQSIGLCNMRAMTLTPVGTFSSSLPCPPVLPLQLQHWPSPVPHRRPTVV